MNIPLDGFAKAARYVFSVSIEGTPYANSWNIWVYPRSVSPEFGGVVYARDIAEAAEALGKGGTVLFNPRPESIDGLPGKFTPVFWSPIHFPREAAAMGVLCDPAHPALAQFPTEMHSDWQWWEPCKNSAIMVADDAPGLSPVVEMVDNFANNRVLSLVSEARCGAGKLVVCSVDLGDDLDQRPVSRQLLHSLLEYMNGDSFSPSTETTVEELRSLLK